ncbi:MAG: hypothetical protein B7Z64_10925 [Acidiphilium sp. 21-68-69]|nr:MAG: hypothetical protein B7Z64_10925 [Acidiphilium sp. 21-68-69]
MLITLAPDYIPSDDEEFMNPTQVEFFRNGTYGYCEETGEPIGLKRLMARPIATLSIEAQERHERQERIQRDD